MSFLLRHIPDALLAAVGLTLLTAIGIWLSRRPFARSLSMKLAIGAGGAGAAVLIITALLFRAARISRLFPSMFTSIVGTAALLLVLALMMTAFAIIVWRVLPTPTRSTSPSRRAFLRTARAAALTAPVATAAYAVFVQRSNLHAREVELPIAGLPPELEGLRLAQLTDIHMSAFLSERELARAVDMANEFRPHVTLVTGDLITSAHDPLDACIRQLSRLRADGAILGCHGNHEIYSGSENYVTRACGRFGMEFLRSQNKILKFGGKAINFAGVDYQPMRSPYLVGGEGLLETGMPNILLSHNPDVFPVAARMGFDGTISGHTHGGQITMEILNQNVSVARFYTPYVYGTYRIGQSAIYVSRGIGTVGIPARLGAPPEVSLIRLCAI